MIIIRPLVQGLADELTSVVDLDPPGQAIGHFQVVHCGHHVVTIEPVVNGDRQTLAGVSTQLCKQPLMI